MILSDEKIIEFQVLYKEHFGKEISKEDAYKQGEKLLRLISIIYRPKYNKEAEIQQAELLQKQK